MNKANVGLGALAAVAVAASAFAVVTVNRPPASMGQAATSAPVASPAPDEQAVETSETPTVVEPRWTLDDARQVLASDAPVVTVLGDSTGDDVRTEWVGLWVTDMRQDRQVWLAGWDRQAGEWSDDLPDGAMHVRNASIPGANAATLTEQVTDLVHEDSDLVIVNLGHNHTTGDVDQIGTLVEESLEVAPDAVVVVMLQQPQVDDANADVRAAVADLAEQHGLPVIDVAAAFEGRDLDELLMDDIHPNEAGSRVWADAVADALG